MRPSVGVVLVAVFVAVGAAFVLLSGDTTPPPLGVGQQAAPFELATLEGGAPVRLSDLRGRVVLLNFWATWCKPCEDEMPSMEGLHRRLAGEPFTLLAVSVDDDAEQVKAFRDRLGLTMPILLDPQKKTAGAYQAFRFPETVLIDAKGEIAGRFIGPRDWDSPTYRETIEALVRGTRGG
ncbi:MAG: TlpA family protein disulfide reductase [Deltaproteobacteria bacterium]|nr:TlpA family protein disulfide reductase [Deltaproteobacteria bacterium]